jgi:RimJ/RimL family protein N-acetyltransferase
MISDNLWRGERVRLTALTKQDTAQVAGWSSDAGLLRLLNAIPARPQTEAAVAKDLEESEKQQNAFIFAIRPTDGDELLGYLELDGILWANGVGWIAIGIGDRANWGKGYGREAMTLALDYAFRELNLHRVQLTVFAYNERAIALYEKLGFQREGVYREFLHRDGKRYDMYLYGLLRAEWESRFDAT